ncbi:MAG: hypothetical protein ABI813_05750 [Bacteroidota bacterium]
MTDLTDGAGIVLGGTDFFIVTGLDAGFAACAFAGTVLATCFTAFLDACTGLGAGFTTLCADGLATDFFAGAGFAALCGAGLAGAFLAGLAAFFLTAILVILFL